MIRTLDAALLNAVANEPDVRPMVGGEGVLDLSGLVADLANVTLVNEHGGFLFVRLDPGRYELHTLFRAAGRGAEALASAAFAFRYLFTRTDCAEIVTRTPASNPAASMMARRAGFRSIFTRLSAWPDGSAVTYFSLTLDDWRGQDPEIAKAGEGFHNALQAAKAGAGSDFPQHAHDDAHDRAAGAAFLMACAGQHHKAVWSYNRWARFAGYQLIEIVSEAPVVIDVRDALIAFQGGQMEVLQCR